MQPKIKFRVPFFEIETNLSEISREMRFFLGVNLVCLPIAAIGFGTASYVISQQLSINAQQAALDNARVMLQTARGMRMYTTNQIAPLLDQEQASLELAATSVHRILDSGLPKARGTVLAACRNAGNELVRKIEEALRQAQKEPPARKFFPQSVPAYAATEAFNYFKEQFPDYSYKEAVLNPTNPRNRTTDWEADIVNMFRKDTDLKEFVGRRETPQGATLYIGTPIRVDDGSCLTCHDTAATAPAELVKHYGGSNGFGWLPNEVIGTRIVSVPATLPEKRAEASQGIIMIWLAGIFGGMCLLTNIFAFKFHRRMSAPAGAPEGESSPRLG